MKILVLGASGMLGHKLCQAAAERFDAVATFRSASAGQLARALGVADWLAPVLAEDIGTVRRVLDERRPDVAVNCVGVVKQLAEAKDPVTSISVNALFPHLLARECRGRGIRLIHVSTDCVFSGKQGRHKESDLSDASDLYGRTKFLGEVDAPGCLTLRTSMIGRELHGSHGLIEWFLSQRGKSVRGFRRAIFSGLTTQELSRVICRVIESHPDLEGLYHVAAEPISKYDLLSLIRGVYGLEVRIEPDDSFVCDRSLDGSRFREATGYSAPSWPEMIAAMRDDPTPYGQIRGESSETREPSDSGRRQISGFQTSEPR
jgi:dTDP-4-dehydrorhamnose reductase